MRERCEGCDTPTPRFTYTADDVALCAECARQLVADELDRLTTRCAELESRVSTQSIALEAIAGMTIDDSTDHAQLSALMKAIAKQTVEGTI